MKLYLIGHDCKYAVEQMLLTMYPNERPEYPEGDPTGDCVVISFIRGKQLSTARCVIYSGSDRYRGAASVSEKDLTADALSLSRHFQRIVKLAFYRAAVRHLGQKPAWGALTGIRPATLMTRLLQEGLSSRAAITEFSKRYDTDRDKSQLCMFAAKAGLRVRENLSPRDICLYVGIPFCPTRCTYCSFVSQSVAKSMHLVEPFLEALFRDIEATAHIVQALDLHVVSIYIGGGTPTTLSPDQLNLLCTQLEGAFDLSHLLEYTVEAGRPDTITAEKMVILHEHGVDRVSINPQSMNDDVLKNIGRNHTAQDIIDAVRIVKSVGGFVINMDLIAGLPGDSEASWSHSLSEVFALEPQNITVHTLAHKKGSAITVAGTDHSPVRTVGKMLLETHNRMMNLGYFPYYLYRQKFTPGGFENVGWCRKGYENRYNVCIMEELCSILAMGGGASTKLVSPTGRIERIISPKYPQEYIAGVDKICSDKNKIKEFYNAISAE
ncbi:MAG: coproporphyrinogen dehydrogenase HemZ [Oscillospiraceae bacterium]